ncbi:MAG: carbohydrate transporter permease [Paenibacillaceae bacterium]|jgi:putative aldouronate transport system permease protein|nr:carbohydrate transporter permease [Paenibacillaceae bacterium]
MNRSIVFSDRLFNAVVLVALIGVCLIAFYPLYIIVIASFSEPDAVSGGHVLLFPRGFTLEGYDNILKDPRIWRGYLNSLIYMTCGTLLAGTITAMAGFALSHAKMAGRTIILRLMVFTMFFNGGLIPVYLTVKKLGLVNTPLAVIILGSVSIFNIVIARAFFQSNIPNELYDAAVMDGCGDGRFFFQVAVPLSKPILAVLAIIYGVHYWNAYFIPLIYLNDASQYPLQLVLKDILIAHQTLASSADMLDLDPLEKIKLERSADLIKYGIIIVSSLPVVLMYPFIQKFFVKGVMIGSIKG